MSARAVRVFPLFRAKLVAVSANFSGHWADLSQSLQPNLLFQQEAEHNLSYLEARGAGEAGTGSRLCRSCRIHSGPRKDSLEFLPSRRLLCWEVLLLDPTFLIPLLIVEFHCCSPSFACLMRSCFMSRFISTPLPPTRSVFPPSLPSKNCRK